MAETDHRGDQTEPGEAEETVEAAEVAVDESEIQSLLTADDPRVRTVLVSLLALAPAARDGEIARVGAELAAVDEYPVFVTDHADFAAFVKGGFFYEYLPPITAQLRHAGGLGWDVYLARKMRLILAKWQPQRVIACGLPIEDYIRRTAEAHHPPRELPP